MAELGEQASASAKQLAAKQQELAECQQLAQVARFLRSSNAQAQDTQPQKLMEAKMQDHTAMPQLAMLA